MENLHPIHISHFRSIKFFSLNKIVDICNKSAIIEYNRICNKDFNLSKIECKRLFVHFITKALCDICIENSEYCVFIHFPNTYSTISNILKKIHTNIPVYIEFTSILESELNSGYYREFTAKFIQWNANKSFSFEKTSKFCEKYKLLFLTNVYFNELTQKQLLI